MSLEKLPPPVIPGNFYAAGLNYKAHIDWATEPALKTGDLVEVVNDAIGVLANRVTRGT
jgi:2-keto-4-pentenoate hydratase/2-oxohepta-3-ene-1,7-dioic acid hydratase in catechol pathway